MKISLHRRYRKVLLSAAAVCMACALSAGAAEAAIYRYKDHNNVEHITNDFTQVPEEYREQFYDRSEPVKPRAVINAEKELEAARAKVEAADAAEAVYGYEGPQTALQRIYAFADRYNARLAVQIIGVLVLQTAVFVIAGYLGGYIVSPPPPRRSRVFDVIVNEPAPRTAKRKAEAQRSFSTGIYDEVIPKEHLLKRLAEAVDFEFVNTACEGLYLSGNVRPEHRPLALFKITFLVFLYGLSGEEVLQELKLQLAYKWFVGLDITQKTPDLRGVIKFRSLLGVEKFQGLYNEIVDKARSNGLMDERLRMLDTPRMEERRTL
ncbi:MAG: transposase [Deltaproteobacteria bacterium]|nr:transposase [Deltaproteobacteria bacterium]